MDQYRHHVSGFFSRLKDAEIALSRLIYQGLPRERLHLFETGSAPPDTVPQTKSNEVLKDVLVDSAIGTAVGTGIGALAEVALVAANVSLFVASPLLAPLMLMGWGASIGGLIGATTGATTSAGNKEGLLSDLIQDAIASGHVVLVADTMTEQETIIARKVIQASVGDFNDVSTVERDHPAGP